MVTTANRADSNPAFMELGFAVHRMWWRQKSIKPIIVQIFNSAFDSGCCREGKSTGRWETATVDCLAQCICFRSLAQRSCFSHKRWTRDGRMPGRGWRAGRRRKSKIFCPLSLPAGDLASTRQAVLVMAPARDLTLSSGSPVSSQPPQPLGR